MHFCVFTLSLIKVFFPPCLPSSAANVLKNILSLESAEGRTERGRVSTGGTLSSQEPDVLSLGWVYFPGVDSKWNYCSQFHFLFVAMQIRTPAYSHGGRMYFPHHAGIELGQEIYLSNWSISMSDANEGLNVLEHRDPPIWPEGVQLEVEPLGNRRASPPGPHWWETINDSFKPLNFGDILITWHIMVTNCYTKCGKVCHLVIVHAPSTSLKSVPSASVPTFSPRGWVEDTTLFVTFPTPIPWLMHYHVHNSYS
jgi:hypothetical protein